MSLQRPDIGKGRHSSERVDDMPTHVSLNGEIYFPPKVKISQWGDIFSAKGEDLSMGRYIFSAKGTHIFSTVTSRRGDTILTTGNLSKGRLYPRRYIN